MTIFVSRTINGPFLTNASLIRNRVLGPFQGAGEGREIRGLLAIPRKVQCLLDLEPVVIVDLYGNGQIILVGHDFLWMSSIIDSRFPSLYRETPKDVRRGCCPPTSPNPFEIVGDFKRSFQRSAEILIRRLPGLR